MKRFPLGAALFALVWALALCLPIVREMPRSVPVWFSWINRNVSGGRLTEFPPDSPVTIEWHLENQVSTDARARSRTHAEFDALSARFPAELWIPAARLRHTTLFLLNLPTHKATPPVSAENVVLVSDWKRAIQIAAACGKREPGNAFWPWMEAVFSFALDQKDEGLAAMERAGNAPHFNDYLQSTLRARLELWGKHDNPVWEERISSYFLFPTWGAGGIMNKACELSASEAFDARERSDNARALRITSALLRANQIWRRDSDFSIGSLIAENSGYRTLDTLFKGRDPKHTNDVNERTKRAVALRLLWQKLARDNGRSDIASRADWLIEPSFFRTYSEPDIWSGFGLSHAQAPYAVAASPALFALGVFCFLLAIVWLAGVLRAKNESPRGQVAACANFGFWALFGGLFVAARTGYLFQIFSPALFWGSDHTSLPAWFLGAFALGCWLLPVAFLNWKGERRFRFVRPTRDAKALPRQFRTARVTAWLMLAVFGILVATNGRGTWDGTPFQLPVSASLLFASALCVLVFEVTRFKRSGRGLFRLRLEGEAPSKTPLAPHLVRFGAWLVVFVCAWLVVGGHEFGSDVPPLSQTASVAVGLGSLALAVFLGRKMGRNPNSPFQLATRVAGVLSLAWSVVFLILAMCAWPLRRELNHQFDRRLAMRETDWMREQLQKFPPPQP